MTATARLGVASRATALGAAALRPKAVWNCENGSGDQFRNPTIPESHNSTIPQSTTFTIVSRNPSRENKYVKSVTLNGKPLADWKICHSDIMSGDELVFEMTDKPTK